ncbi:DJ-1/PfpI family protein [Paraherbaspirillum soli]|uniref:DJ-1/PfpI family protein n=1 Tax=Paraherbaspirillum soli TaxID=631222 RepID=A0ABW0M5B7_9BURK
MMNRRNFTRALGLTALPLELANSARAGNAEAGSLPAQQPLKADAPFHIGMLIFPGMTNLDFAGPFEVLARVPGATVHVLAKSDAPVRTDVGGTILPSMTLKDAPELDMLFVGGGPGVNALMEDGEVLEFLRSRARRAQWVSSVCTGALVLGAAGLLRGYRAATHWTAMDVLPLLGATPVRQRVVIDRNRITGGGVTAGIDFGLTVVGLLWGKELAQTIQLGLEYDPQPPFNSGSPQNAPAPILARVRSATTDLTERRMAIAKRAAGNFS